MYIFIFDLNEDLGSQKKSVVALVFMDRIATEQRLNFGRSIFKNGGMTCGQS